MLDSRALLLATMLVAVSSACSDSRHEDAPSEPAFGAAQQAFCFNHTIVNVVVAPGTYHWEDPGHLLNAAEGFGPMSLNLSIQTSVGSASTSSSSYTPEESEISTAVGYDVSEETSLQAATTVLVPFGGYKRVEAYATYKKSIWDILDTNCNGPDVLNVGAGVSLKAVGVYFKVCAAFDCSLGGGLVGGDPMLSGPHANPPGGGAGSSTSGAGSGSSSSSSTSGAGSGSSSSGTSGAGGSSSSSSSGGSGGSGGTGGV
jgi:hypothetical protein